VIERLANGEPITVRRVVHIPLMLRASSAGPAFCNSAKAAKVAQSYGLRMRLVGHMTAQSHDEHHLSWPSQGAARQGSLFQYFDDNLDLYRWLVAEETPRHKRAFLGTPDPAHDFWVSVETLVVGAELHEVLASDSLRKRLGGARRRRLAQQAVLLIRGGLGADAGRSSPQANAKQSKAAQASLKAAPKEFEMTSHDFSGRVVFITGGTSGIGLATARAFARSGARVVVTSRNEQAGREACATLERDGAEALFVRTDVREEELVARAIEQTVERFGRLDFAFNCAGVGGDMQPFERANQEVWDDVVATNMRGTWLCMRYEIPAMLASGGGAIVNMSSIYAMAGKAAHHAYVASKHAVLGMTRSVALEYAGRGIRVNAVCAGVTATAGMCQAEAAFPELVHALVAQHPMGRMASEAEIAEAVLWLCSAGAGYVTGTPLAVDGGFLAA
jgi:NAD(P)-dependent dehydrogenase (short-subunit alcohol dehydrogenase family)